MKVSGTIATAAALIAAVVGPFVTAATVSASAPREPASPAARSAASVGAPGDAGARCVGPANTPGGADPWGGCWPGPHNTGYPQGLPGDARARVTLEKYTGPTTIRACGRVIDSKVVTSEIILEAGNGTHSPDTPCLTIKNSLVKGVIHTDSIEHGPVVVTDTEVAVPELSWWENIGRYNTFVWRVDSHGSEGVIKCAAYCAAYDSYVHGMYLGGAYHYNAFGGNGMEAGSFVIRHNWASCGDWSGVDPELSDDAGCSASIGFYGDFDPIRNIRIKKNFLAGMTVDPSVPSAGSRQPGYCLNPGYYEGKPYPAPRNVKVINNVFGRGASGKCGVYGPTNSLHARGEPNGNVWEDNRYADGRRIRRPQE